MDNNKDMTFTLDEFDDAVAETCVKISSDRADKKNSIGAAHIIMAGMMFSAMVRKRLESSKKEDK